MKNSCCKKFPETMDGADFSREINEPSIQLFAYQMSKISQCDESARWDMPEWTYVENA